MDDLFINTTLRQGTGFVGGRVRVFKKYEQGELTADWLAKEYGTDGWMPACELAWGSRCDFNGKGMDITRGNERVSLKWTEVADRISRLIEQGEYLTSKERSEVAPQSFTLVDLILNGGI